MGHQLVDDPHNQGTDMTTTDAFTGTYAGIDDLTVTLDGGVLAVTLNRPDSLNSLTAPMLATFAEALEKAATDPRVRVVRVGGAGRGFSSGAGISEEDHANPGAAGTPADVLDAANRCIRAIVNLPNIDVSPRFEWQARRAPARHAGSEHPEKSYRFLRRFRVGRQNLGETERPRG